ncbi:MAG: hypothetical protein OEY77_01205 [Nitrospira sp.]|nr:hypothetical protein [Nitrospira sp.]
MNTRKFTPVWILGATLFLIILGCGQPRVYVTTSTTVGLEATPPMSDGSGMPRVMFGYKRAEVAFIPVCPVEKYEYSPPWFNWLAAQLNFSTNNTPCPIDVAQSKLKETDTADANTTQGVLHPPSTLSTGPGGTDTRKDAYSTLGLFRLGLSWFGPAKIEQFVATGQAAIAIQKPDEKDKLYKSSGNH